MVHIHYYSLSLNLAQIKKEKKTLDQNWTFVSLTTENKYN